MSQCRSKYDVLLMTQCRSKYDVLLMTQCRPSMNSKEKLQEVLQFDVKQNNSVFL